MEVIYTLNEEYLEKLHRLYQSACRSLEPARLCVKGFQIYIGFIDSTGQLIGFTRVITNYVFKALTFDVIVCESQQGMGLGNKLISLAKQHERLKEVKHSELYCVSELHSFYTNVQAV